MPTVTVRNLADDTKRGLQELGALHGRSMEAEARAILDAAVRGSANSGQTPLPASVTGGGSLAERIHQRFVDLNLDTDVVIELPERRLQARPTVFDDEDASPVPSADS